MEKNKLLKVSVVFLLNILFINVIQSIYLFVEVNFLSKFIPFYFYTYLFWIVLAYVNVKFIYKKRTNNIFLLSTLTLLLCIFVSFLVNTFGIAGGISIIEGSSNSFIKDLFLSLISYNTTDIIIVMTLSLFISILLDWKNKSNWTKFDLSKEISNFNF